MIERLRGKSLLLEVHWKRDISKAPDVKRLPFRAHRAYPWRGDATGGRPRTSLPRRPGALLLAGAHFRGRGPRAPPGGPSRAEPPGDRTPAGSRGPIRSKRERRAREGTKPVASGNPEAPAPARPPRPARRPTPETPRLTTCRGRRRAPPPQPPDESPEPATPDPRRWASGATARGPRRGARREGAVEALGGSEEGAARARRGPAARPAAPRRPRSARAPAGTPRAQPALRCRFMEPSPRPLLLRDRSARSPGERANPPSPAAPLPCPDCPSFRGAPGNAPRGPGPPRALPAVTRAPRRTPPAGRSPLTSGGSGGAEHRKLLGPRLRLSSTPSSVNSACFSTKWRRRSRAHVAAFPLPVPISSFAARPRRDGPAPANDRDPPVAPAQSPAGARGFEPITHDHLQKSRKKPGSC